MRHKYIGQLTKFFLANIIMVILIFVDHGTIAAHNGTVAGFLKLGEYQQDPKNRAAVPITYHLSVDEVTQYVAWINCENIFNGKLLTISSQNELNAIRQFLTVNSQTGKSFWTAGIQDGVDWVWLTTAQTIVNDLLFWYTGYPKISCSTQKSLAIQVNSIGTLAGYNNDHDGENDLLTYICQS